MFCLDLPTISFCEGIYNDGLIIDGISEFWNTISSLFFCFVGIWHLYKLKGDYELVSILILTLMVGIGSAIFHSVPTRINQMMDELPMIFLIIGSIKMSHQHIFLQRGYDRKIYYLLSFMVEVLGCMVIIFNVFSLYFLIFEIFYIMMILIYVGITVYGNWKHRKEIMKVVIMGLFSFIFWLIDQHICNRFLGLFSLHFFWHLGMSLVVFNFVEFYKIMKLESNNKRVVIKQWGPFFIAQTTGFVEFEDEI